VVANESVIERDFLPALEAAGCPDLGAPTGVFRVLQVDDEGGQGINLNMKSVRAKVLKLFDLDFSGRRICEISEPLAEGRFSILYISTYQTDFVLVSEVKLSSVVQVLRQDGFEVEEEYDEYGDSIKEEEEEYLEEELVNNRSLSPVDPTQFLLDTNVLDNQLICVGLNRHFRTDWVTTVLKILCYPDLTHCYK
jgi:hypothetical protein